MGISVLTPDPDYSGKAVDGFDPLPIMRQFDLTIKQAYFCEWYLITMNGSKAARNAGYAEPCNVAGSRTLSLPNVRKYLEHKFAERKISASEIIDRLKAIAEADISDYLIVDPVVAEEKHAFKLLSDGRILDGVWVDIKRCLIDGNTGAIKSYKKVKGETVIELHDKVRALELLGRHYRLFADVLITPPKANEQDLSDEELTEIARRYEHSASATPADDEPMVNQ